LRGDEFSECCIEAQAASSKAREQTAARMGPPGERFNQALSGDRRTEHFAKPYACLTFVPL